MNEPAPKTLAESRRGNADTAYVLHAQPWRETSLLLETFTEEHGRVVMVARGARRPRSALRGVLLAFHPLTLGWIGKTELRTLTKAEWLGGRGFLRGDSLLCGYYLNELLIRLLPREDAHEHLFARYGAALAALVEVQSAGADANPAPVLRSFEKALLAELGYALTLDGDARGAAIEPAAVYCYYPEQGPQRVEGPAYGSAYGSPRGPITSGAAGGHGGGLPVVRGQTLIDIGRDHFADAGTLAEAKALMRSLINHRLDNAALRSRRVYRDLLDMTAEAAAGSMT